MQKDRKTPQEFARRVQVLFEEEVEAARTPQEAEYLLMVARALRVPNSFGSLTSLFANNADLRQWFEGIMRNPEEERRVARLLRLASRM